MDRIVELGRLMDYYGALLTERQQRMLGQAVNEDLSLSEISEREGMTRQGVRDAILHGEQQLRLYESVLHLVERSARMQKRIALLTEAIENAQLSDEEKQRLFDRVNAVTAVWEEEDGV